MKTHPIELGYVFGVGEGFLIPLKIQDKKIHCYLPRDDHIHSWAGSPTWFGVKVKLPKELFE